MRSLIVGLLTVGAWTAAVLPVSAGWDNVFQPTLFHRRQQTTSAYYVQPAVVYASPAPVVAQSVACETCAPPPPPCTTNYVQRCYYQPVTTYQSKTVLEPVTTYRTSYYYEPVVSYRYTSQYDPCTGCCQQVAVPCTSYQLRAQNCPVQSWVQRCVQEPVTTYQKSCYWQPQTTCCSTSVGATIVTPAPASIAAPPPVVQTPSIASPEPPKVITNQPPAGTPPQMWNQYYPPQDRAPAPPEIKTNPNSYKQPQLSPPVPLQPGMVNPPPVKLDRIAVGPNSQVDGQVVKSDNSPRANAKVLFVNASSRERQTVTANGAGRFQVELPAGSWHVYLYGADDVPLHHARIDVNGAQSRQINLVSRSN